MPFALEVNPTFRVAANEPATAVEGATTRLAALPAVMSAGLVRATRAEELVARTPSAS